MARRDIATALAVILPGALATSPSSGLTTCPCLEWAGLDQHLSGGKVIYRPVGSGSSYEWPGNYGNNFCQSHDQSLAPMCNRQSNPSWCQDKWCWVSKDNCQGASYVRSVLFPDVKDLYFSYGTCGSVDSFSKWAEQLKELHDVVTGYLQSSQAQLELAYRNAGNFDQECVWQDQCTCTDCQQNTFWNQKVNPSEVGTWLRPGANTESMRKVSCMTKAVGDTYRRVAAKETTADNERVGYQYFADQQSGSLIQWPLAEFCPRSDWDPRYRPWYAAGASGPKDVIIVVDVSGSMQTKDRDAKALRAAKAILDTLVWKDFATIILFNHGISANYAEKLVPVTNGNRVVMKAWLDAQVSLGKFALGGTNFKAPLDLVWSIIEESVNAGDTSTCQRAVMFLTDGSVTNFGEEEFASVQQMTKRWDATLFSYALGSDADVNITKRLACENRGIFYKVADDEANYKLEEVMAAYYTYFAAGQTGCEPSFQRYSDNNTGEILYAGCLPMKDRDVNNSSLLGVSCMDLNMIASIDELKAKDTEAWDSLACRMSSATKKCRHLYLSDCHLEKLRMQFSMESVCGASPDVASQACPCLDRTCQDDATFVDELGYTCDGWVGDDCSNATEQFGYSEAGQKEVLQKCKRSCGLCQEFETCPYTEVETCAADVTSSTCSACDVKVSGVGIDSEDMCCPEKAGLYTPRCGKHSVTGSIRITVSKPADFAKDASALQRVAEGIAEEFGVPPTDVFVKVISQTARRLTAGSSSVVLSYSIYADSPAAASAIQSIISGVSSTALRAAMDRKVSFYSISDAIVQGVPPSPPPTPPVPTPPQPSPSPFPSNPWQPTPSPSPPWRTPSPAPDTATDSSDDPGGGDVGVIIGIVAGCVVGLLAAGAAIWFFLLRGKKSSAPKAVAADPAPVAAMVIPPGAAMAMAPVAVAAAPAPPAAAAAPAPVPKSVCPPPDQRLALPSVWKNKAKERDFFSLENQPDLLPAVQKMLDATWKAVKTRDRRDGSEPKQLIVTEVKRIENNVLYQRYLAERDRISKKRSHPCTRLERLRGGQAMTVTSEAGGLRVTTSKLEGRVNETLLWHGTSPEGALGIARNGFDLSRAGSAAGSMYGPGVYLAEHCSKSDEYAKDDLYSGVYCLLLCRAILGEPMSLTAGGDSMHAAIKSGMDGGAVDSVLGDREASVGTYREFIVYREEQVYPEFIVLYKRGD